MLCAVVCARSGLTRSRGIYILFGSMFEQKVDIRLQLLYFFFFQAEDGIRDLTVTGVQTCALPISASGAARPRGPAGPSRRPRPLTTSRPLPPGGPADAAGAALRRRSVRAEARPIAGPPPASRARVPHPAAGPPAPSPP